MITAKLKKRPVLKAVVTKPYQGKGYADGYNVGVEDGKKAEYDAFWDAFQQNGTKTAYNYAFYNPSWTDENFRPKYDIKPTKTGGERMFANSHITNVKQILLDCGVVLDTSGLTTASAMCQAANHITHMPYLDLSNCSSLNNAFQSCFNMVELHIKVSENASFVNAFYSCPVQELTIEGTIGKDISLGASNLLTDASVQSVIDALKDLTGATAQTLTFHKDVGNKLTEEQKAAITAKNWTLVY